MRVDSYAFMHLNICMTDFSENKTWVPMIITFQQVGHIHMLNYVANLLFHFLEIQQPQMLQFMDHVQPIVWLLSYSIIQQAEIL